MHDFTQTIDEAQEPDKIETSTKLDSWHREMRSCIRRTELLSKKIRYCTRVQQEQVSEMVDITKQDSLTRKERSQKFIECARRYAFVDGELEREKHKSVSSGNSANKRRLQKNWSARAKKKMKESLVVPMIETIFSLIDERKQMVKRHLEVEQKLAAVNASNRLLHQRINDLESSLTPFAPVIPLAPLTSLTSPTSLSAPPSLLNCHGIDVSGEGNIAQCSWNISERGANSSRVNAHGCFQKQHRLTLDNNRHVVTPSMERSIELSSEIADVTNANKESERTARPSFQLPDTSVMSNTSNNLYRTELNLECLTTSFPLNSLCDEQRSNALTGPTNVHPVDNFCGIEGL